MSFPNISIAFGEFLVLKEQIKNHKFEIEMLNSKNQEIRKEMNENKIDHDFRLKYYQETLEERINELYEKIRFMTFRNEKELKEI